MNRISGGMAPYQEGPSFHSSVPQELTRITQQLSDYLREKQTDISRAFDGIDSALQALDRSESISSTFQDCGFYSWLAYVLASRGDKHLDETLRKISPDNLSTIADNVSKVSVESSITQRVQHTLWDSRRAKARRAQLERVGISFPSNARKRPRVQSLDNHDELSVVTRLPNTNNMTSDTTQTDNANPVSHPAAPQPTEELHTLDQASRPIFIADPEWNYSYPNASKIPSVFESELGDIIVRSDYTASIFASFPRDPAKCRLWLDVEASAVVPLAMKLYGIQIVEMEQQRAFTLPGGASVGIIGSVKLNKTKEYAVVGSI
ncbi:uncharacterized protein FIESC28_10885 [Fusarium coffeatum]|uniref:Uncharacterized protein n=1 Tax=Fusarium coffeatum TaxID=231269 RepID=A0A366QPT0_9HYPO|nr:uncharacterized protein FIESC28_10885 [Fusarium coffeatum]RBR06914.1 hypothetical protein FIESC28_10885 [Fusarium coffeatum]